MSNLRRIEVKFEDDDGEMRTLVTGEAEYVGLVVKLERDGGPIVISMGEGADAAVCAGELLNAACDRDEVPHERGLQAFCRLFMQLVKHRQEHPTGRQRLQTTNIAEAEQIASGRGLALGQRLHDA